MCALSGGVDSSVLAFMLHKILKKNLICVYIDTGFMRLNETSEICKIYKEKFKKNFLYLNKKNTFYKNLKGISDPERKKKSHRKNIYKNF